MQRFNVTLRFRFPSWDYKSGVPYQIEAERDGHVPMRGMGAAIFTATPAQ